MNQAQVQIRTDIEYLANSWKSPKIYPVNGDISKDKSFKSLPALLTFIKPLESKPMTNGGKMQTYSVELLLIYAKLPDGCDPTEKGHDYDEQSSEMANIIDKLFTGMTKQYIAGVKNPIAHARGYTAKDSLTFLDCYFEWGSNKYMALRANFSLNASVKECFTCNDYTDGTFDSVNVPPYNSNPIGGGAGQTGDILYWSASLGKWVRMHIGGQGQVLTVVGDVPTWQDATGGGGGSGIGKPIFFNAVAGQNAYTEADVPRLAEAVGNYMVTVSIDGSQLSPSMRNWDDTTFTISADVTLQGGEYIVINHQTI